MNYTMYVTLKSDDKESLANMLNVLAAEIHDPSMGSNQVAALDGKLIFEDKDSIEWETPPDALENINPAYRDFITSRRYANNYGKMRR